MPLWISASKLVIELTIRVRLTTAAEGHPADSTAPMALVQPVARVRARSRRRALEDFASSPQGRGVFDRSPEAVARRALREQTGPRSICAVGSGGRVRRRTEQGPRWSAGALVVRSVVYQPAGGGGGGGVMPGGGGGGGGADDATGATELALELVHVLQVVQIATRLLEAEECADQRRRWPRSSTATCRHHVRRCRRTPRSRPCRRAG